jgi:modulator of FtsH protease HflK
MGPMPSGPYVGKPSGRPPVAWVHYVPVAVIAVFALSGVWTAFFAVPAESVAVVTRLGRFDRIEEPGLRLKLPWGIEQMQPVPVRRQLKVEFGYGTPGASNPHQVSSTDEQQREKRMVTGDLNVAMVEWVVQYRIADAHAFLFDVRDPELTLRDLSESVMRQVVGDRTVDEVITVGRQSIEFDAMRELQRLAGDYALGITVDQVQLKDVNPPAPVQASFNEVNQAQQERERSINVAKGQFNKAIPQAKGAADQQYAEAEGYAAKRVNEARGDAQRFTALAEEYRKAPDVTRRRLYLETLQEVLPKLGRRVVVDDQLKQFLPLLQLSDTPVNTPVPPLTGRTQSGRSADR